MESRSFENPKDELGVSFGTTTEAVVEGLHVAVETWFRLLFEFNGVLFIAKDMFVCVFLECCASNGFDFY